MKTLAIILLVIFISASFMSLATSFVLWDWQWFWESPVGLRLAILLAIAGGGSQAR